MLILDRDGTIRTRHPRKPGLLWSLALAITQFFTRD